MEDPLASVFAEPILTDSGIRKLVEALPQLESSRREYQRGVTILEEGERNDRLIILMEGEALLIKRDGGDRHIVVDTFGPGALLGLTSFWGKTQVFASIEAATNVVCVSIPRELFDSLTRDYPDFVRAVQGLFVRNLSDRYRNMVRAQVARDKLSTQLEEERNQLRDTLKRLEQTTNRLVNQEKLATMGQLLAGIAHEINNPVGALLRGIDSAKTSLLGAFLSGGRDSVEGVLLHEGLDCPFWSSEEKRARMDAVLKAFPDIGRPLARRLAQMTDRAFGEIRPKIAKGGRDFERLMAVFDLGVCFRAVRLSGSRIERIVTSLRNYGRQGSADLEEADLADGVRDTLTVLNHRLKRYELELALEELPPFACHLGEINQVWTNLIVNAMDATPEGGRIRVAAKVEESEIVVRIEDSGTGIVPEKLETVFEANYTTKNTSGSFGLGLGLSISREIVEKHGGTLKASNRAEGGARFEARFPV